MIGSCKLFCGVVTSSLVITTLLQGPWSTVNAYLLQTGATFGTKNPFLSRKEYHTTKTTTTQSSPMGYTHSLPNSFLLTTKSQTKKGSMIRLQAAMDPITSLRTEYVAAALCTNQIPRSADVCLQLGCEDGRIVTFVPRTIRSIITSSLEDPINGILSVTARRRLKQAQERRNAATIQYVDQPADNLREIANESIDIVVSIQAAQKMFENGLDWKKSIKEAARVLKPGGRFLFVENTEINGENYLEYVQNLTSFSISNEENTSLDQNSVVSTTTVDGTSSNDDDIMELVPIFEVGYDAIDLVLIPHVAGVAMKTEEAGLTPDELNKKRKVEEEERLADLSILAYERGIKKRKKKKKESSTTTTPTTTTKTQ